MATKSVMNDITAETGQYMPSLMQRTGLLYDAVGAFLSQYDSSGWHVKQRISVNASVHIAWKIMAIRTMLTNFDGLVPEVIRR